MTSKVLIENALPDPRGWVELKVNRTFQVNISAEQARRFVHDWLVNEVSSNIGAEIPVLVLADDPIWRVPAWLSFPRYGRVGEVGFVDVDVVTGKIQNQIQSKREIEEFAEELMQRFSLQNPGHRKSLPRMTTLVAAAPRLALDEDDYLPNDELVEIHTAPN